MHQSSAINANNQSLATLPTITNERRANEHPSSSITIDYHPMATQ